MKSDLAIDLGTENTLIQSSGSAAPAWSEPSLVAYRNGEALVAGFEALRMEGRTTDPTSIVRPLEDGVIVQLQAAVDMLRLMLKPRLARAPGRVLLSFPHAITQIEKMAFRDLALQLGPRQVLLVKEPLAAAVGSGLDILRTRGHMIVDLGKGIIEAVVIVRGEVVSSSALRLQGRTENERLGQYLKDAHGLTMGAAKLEELKLRLHQLPRNEHVEVKGISSVPRLPRRLLINVSELLEILDPYAQAIAACVLEALEQTPVELLGDVMEHGIYLTGGGALSEHVVHALGKWLDLPLQRVSNPLQAVALGNRQILNDPQLQRNLGGLTL